MPIQFKYLFFLQFVCYSILSLNCKAQNEVKQVESLLNSATSSFGEAALPALTKARGICRTLTCPDELLGQVYHQLSVAYFQGYIDDAQAIRYADSAIYRFEKIFSTNHPKLANEYYNRAVMQMAIGQMNPAANGFITALSKLQKNTLLTAAETDSVASFWLPEIAKTFRLKRDFFDAEKYANLGLSIAQKRWPEPKQIHGDFLRSLGNIRYDRQDHLQAIQYFLRARKAYEDQGPAASRDLIITDQNLGLAYQQSGKHAKAVGYLEEVLSYLQRLYQERPSNSLKQDLANAHINLLIVKAGLKQFAQAQGHYQDAQELLDDLFPLQNSVLHAELYYAQGLTMHAQERRQEALAACSLAKDILLPQSSGEVMVTGPIEYVIKTLALEGKIKTEQKEYNAALQTYEAFHEIISSYRRRELSGWSKYYLISDIIPVYEEAIELCLRLYNETEERGYLEQAYAFNNRNKAIILRESLQHEEAIAFAGLPVDVQQKEATLRQRLTSLNQQLFQRSSSSPQDSLNALLLAAEIEHTQFQKELEEKYPRYYQLKYTQQGQIKATDVQDRLAPNQALIEYFCGDDHWYAFLITTDDFRAYQLTLSPKLEDDIRLYHELLTNGIAEDCEKDFLALAHHLYQQLLTDPLTDIPTDQVQRLVIIPDGLLHFVAFESLLASPREQIEGSQHFLVERFAFSYHYSPYFFVHPLMPVSKKTKRRFFGGFGLEYDDYTLQYLDTVFRKKEVSESDPIQLPCGKKDRLRSLGKLYFSDEEVRAIADLLSGDYWLNEEATKSAFISQTENYRILHLALHGSYDLDYPMNSALAFTKTRQNEALLSAREVYGMHLHCEMITLSACNTNFGKLMPGEGAMTLARAFNYAGVPTVVASLWSLPDHSTSLIMPLFYQGLNEGLTKDVALQQAKIQYLKDDALSTPTTRLPTFWAPAIVIGNTNPFNEPTGWWPHTLFYLLSVVLLISIVVAARKRKKQRHRNSS